MIKTKVLNVFCLFPGVTFAVSIDYQHHWPLGEGICRGPWVASHHYLDVIEEPIWEERPKEGYDETSIAGHTERHHVFHISGGDGRNAVPPAQKWCDDLKDIAYQMNPNHPKENIINVTSQLIFIGTPRNKVYKRHCGIKGDVKTSEVDATCKISWTLVIKTPKKGTDKVEIGKKYHWLKSSNTMTSFVFKDNPIELPKQPPKDKNDAESGQEKLLEDYYSLIRELLIAKPYHWGVLHPSKDIRWDMKYHTLTHAICMTCDHIPVTNAIEVEEKRRCLKASIYMFSNLSEDLKIDNSPLVLELIYELSQLYIKYFDLIPYDKREEAKTFIHTYRKLESPISSKRRLSK